MSKPAAHIRATSRQTCEIHDLEEHLREVAKLAGHFATPFGGHDWADLAGLWHDLGKYRPRFQRYLDVASGFDRRSGLQPATEPTSNLALGSELQPATDPDAHIEGRPGKVTHSTAGALLACQRLGVPGRVLAYLIAGHHAGLSDWHSEESSLAHRLDGDRAAEELREALAAEPPADLLTAHEGNVLDLRQAPGKSEGFALWVRMLFSCLVDADFLDTEAFMDGVRAGQRGGYPDIATLLCAFNRHMGALTADVAATGPLSTVNRLRADILQQCRAKAAETPGVFTLTVPTGGGKTLSSLAFGLEHARRHGKRRIIYVIPYTSIIEQTADIFREVFRDLEPDPVVEHHSNIDVADIEETARSRLACENWDAPIIVTTNVQFFESLFAARTSRCRKLHNLTDSIVILDEAQMLPPDYLQPILDVLRLLTRHYGMTVVLSTATQPALTTRQYFDPSYNIRGLDDVRELMAHGPHVQEPDELYRALQRVKVELPQDWHAPRSWPDLAQELAGHAQVLCIVNRRKEARELFQAVHRQQPEGTLHLSALMCGAHRADVIQRIKERLAAGLPTRVVSTQLVEAGVNLDFPLVYRALAGLDSIAQAAGRCNREGLLTWGRVVVFIPPRPAPPGFLLRAENASRGVLHGWDGDPLDRALFSRYFEHPYAACDLDRHGIGKLLAVDSRTLAVNFRTAAARFRLIADEDTVPVIVRYHPPGVEAVTLDALLGKLRKDGPERWLIRKLQRYTVTVHRRDAARWAAAGDLEEWQPGCYLQVSDVAYSDQLGLVLGDDAGPLPVLYV